MEASTEGVTALRWRLARVYDARLFSSPEEAFVDVSVRECTAAFSAFLDRKEARKLRKHSEEDNRWWSLSRKAGESCRVEGFAGHRALVEALLERNLKRPSVGSTSERGITEDMVVIQVGVPESVWLECLEAHRKTLSCHETSTDIADLTPLALYKGSEWLDITRLARQRAKKVYKRALGEGATSLKGDGHAAKS